MILAGIKVTNTALIRDAIDLARSSSEPYLFNHVMRSWLFGIVLSENAKPLPKPKPFSWPHTTPPLKSRFITDGVASTH